MKMLRSVVLPLFSAAAMALGLIACGGGSSRPPISVTLSTAPPANLQAGTQTSVAASVMNDSSNAGVDWSVTCGSAGACGSFSPTHTASGSATTYTAPAAVPAGNTVTITAASTADTTKSASVTITITPPPISVTLSTAPPATLQAGSQTSVAASVMNDSSNAGVDWSVTCGSAGACGSFSPTHTASGSATTYTAPAAVPTGNTVTITATSTADTTKSASATITITPPLISVSFMPAPPSSLVVNATAMLTAVVSNDSSNAGADWSVTCGSAGACGSFSPTHTASGSATTYTAPAAVPAGNTVTVIATSTADSTKSVSGNITIATPTDASLSGSYVFVLSGFDAFGSAYSLAGQLTADGAGNITGGEQDFSDFFVSLFDSFTGTYSIGPDGRGTITVNTGDTGLPGGGTETLGLVVVTGSHFLVTEFDSSATSSGTMDLQTLTTFSASTLSGGYAFALSGIDVVTGFPLVWGGVLNVNSAGGISGAGSVADEDDNGTVRLSSTASGSFPTPDPLGRVVISLTTGFASGITVVGYIADATHVKLVETDIFLGVTGGTALGQGTNTGTFTSNSAVSGNLVFSAAGASTLGSTVAAGLLTADGSGTITSGTVDVEAGGTPTTTPVTGTYAVDSSGTGRGVITLAANPTGLTTIAFYLVGAGSPTLVLNLDTTSLASGMAFQQAAGPFSASSFSGPYGTSFTNFSTLGVESDATGLASADGIGSLTGTADINEARAPTSNLPLTGTFTANSNGRFTGTLTTSFTGTINVAFYIVDSTQVLFIETDTAGVTLGVFQLQVQPLP